DSCHRLQGPIERNFFSTQLLWGSRCRREHPPAINGDEWECGNIRREKLIQSGSQDSKLQLGSV
ncbi:hypothetical protein scyTo_0018844, partial [Scyliorhinus torazame]|nr:hypothetical protein [Scyliorhinus torazame]